MRRTYEMRGPATGTLKSEQMDLLFERGYICVEFYSDGSYNDLVKPTDGTVRFTGSINDKSYSSFSNGMVFAINTGASGRYSLPTFQGPIAFVKAKFSSIAGATHAIINISKYE